MIVETPQLDKISYPDWLSNRKYTPLEMVDIKTLTDNEVWVTAQRVKIPVRQMTTRHINNCINCLLGEGKSQIPEGYLGGKEKWLDIFNREILNRQ